MIHTSKQIDERNIEIYDEVFEPFETFHLYNYCCNSYFQRTNRTFTHAKLGANNLKWHCELNENDIDSIGLIKRYAQRIPFFKNKKIEVIRQYINYTMFDTIDLIHADTDYETSLKDPYQYTVLQYANYLWDNDWFGETLFYNSLMNEIQYASMVVPGRVIIFDPKIPHAARAPSRLADYPRYTIATKMRVINES